MGTYDLFLIAFLLLVFVLTVVVTMQASAVNETTAEKRIKSLSNRDLIRLVQFRTRSIPASPVTAMAIMELNFRLAEGLIKNTDELREARDLVYAGSAS